MHLLVHKHRGRWMWEALLAGSRALAVKLAALLVGLAIGGEYVWRCWASSFIGRRLVASESALRRVATQGTAPIVTQVHDDTLRVKRVPAFQSDLQSVAA